MSLLSIPVELLSKILTSGTAIADLLNVSRTSQYPRSVCLGNRAIWRLALDSEMLPMPVGTSLDSIEMPLLLCCAARAVSIAEALRRPMIIPKESVELKGLYDLPPWRMCLEGWPTRVYVLPGGHSFLIGESRLALFDMRGTYAYEFEAGDPRTPCAFVWESQNNGASTILAVVWINRASRDSSLSAYKLEYDKVSSYRNPPSISQVYSCEISQLTAPVQMDIHNSLILIWDKKNKMFLMDILRQQRVRLMDFECADNPSFNIIHANLDPKRPMTILVSSFEDDDENDGYRRFLEIVEFELLPRSNDALWETSYSAHRRIADMGTYPSLDHRFLHGTIRFYGANSIIMHEIDYGRTQIRTHRWSIRLSLTPSDNLIEEDVAEYEGGDTRSCFRAMQKIPSKRLAFAFRASDVAPSQWRIVQIDASRNCCSELHAPLHFSDSRIGFDDVHVHILESYCLIEDTGAGIEDDMAASPNLALSAYAMKPNLESLARQPAVISPCTKDSPGVYRSPEYRPHYPSMIATAIWSVFVGRNGAVVAYDSYKPNLLVAADVGRQWCSIEKGWAQCYGGEAISAGGCILGRGTEEVDRFIRPALIESVDLGQKRPLQRFCHIGETHCNYSLEPLGCDYYFRKSFDELFPRNLFTTSNLITSGLASLLAAAAARTYALGGTATTAGGLDEGFGGRAGGLGDPAEPTRTLNVGASTQSIISTSFSTGAEVAGRKMVNNRATRKPLVKKVGKEKKEASLRPLIKRLRYLIEINPVQAKGRISPQPLTSLWQRGRRLV
ncbi:hypothetical protein C8R43DRAFT_960941 [Mycena crocata]|nr:hypothetical protein C8R43DRAFT_960941 [Mycena crocata]